MFYETKKKNHGLKYDPFKSCIIPRPIAWITTISNNGEDNCAPYSFFNGVASDPPMVMFANNGPAIIKEGPKDTFSNIKDNSEFVINISTYNNKDKMNETCFPLAKGESEIDLAKLETRESKIVKPKILSESPINMECKLHQIIDLPVNNKNEYNGIIIGQVLGIHIQDDYILNGIIDVKKLKPLARLGYMDYSIIDSFFQMNRPKQK
jgi:flavin reductase (DIM6/NTAB) family NADH-FMN oxidoreductase RutF